MEWRDCGYGERFGSRGLSPRQRSGDLETGFFVEVFIEFLAAQHRVKALDGADGDPADRVERVRGEMLDVVKLGELAPGIGCDELLELGGGLASEIRAVHEKEHAARSGVFDEPVGEGAGGKRFFPNRWPSG